MTVEAAVYINTLDATLPSEAGAGDPISEGDNHLRLIKASIKASFPAITGPMTLTQAQINGIPASITSAFNSATSISQGQANTAQANAIATASADATAKANAAQANAIAAAATDATAKANTAQANAIAAAATDATTKANAAQAAAIAAAAADATTKANAAQAAAVAQATALFQTAYPVGALYLSAIATNPAGQLGFGTWTAFGAGRVLIGVGTGTDSNAVPRTFSALETDGEYSHTSTVSEMPLHGHPTRQVAEIANSAAGNVIGGLLVNNSPAQSTYGAYSGTPDAAIGHQIGGSGGGLAHNNVQPYIAVYIWRRTA